MKNHRALLLLLIVPVLLAVASCRERTDRSEGTVLLSVSDFDGLPFAISLNADDPPYTIEQIVLRNTAKEPGGVTGPLMDIELRSYEVRYRRRDAGTRIPPSAVQGVFGVVPVNSTFIVLNLPFMFSDQVLSQPLKDLRDFGIDRETGTTVIVLDVSLVFFGRTLSGDEIVSEPATFTIEVHP
jgi:hypothetical protein